MITYVNTVLVGKGAGVCSTNATSSDTGKYIVVDNDGTVLTAATAANAEAIKVGIVTDQKPVIGPNGNQMPIIKWSNVIKKANIKSYHYTAYAAETEDAVTFNFATAVSAAATKNIRVVVRLTFFDMPTRYRKWTESYEVAVAAGSTANDIVDAFVTSINVKNAKRARVTASNSSNTLVVTAMPYEDDNAVDTISPAAKIRFTGSAWYTMPEAAGFASKNKYNAATVTKTDGVSSDTYWKRVRDAESNALGYTGIINRGQGTWPIIKPKFNVDENAKYDALTIEFENMYRAADDIQRHTKQCLQVFEKLGASDATQITALKNIIEAFVAGVDTSEADATADQLEEGATVV